MCRAVAGGVVLLAAAVFGLAAAGCGNGEREAPQPGMPSARGAVTGAPLGSPAILETAALSPTSTSAARTSPTAIPPTARAAPPTPTARVPTPTATPGRGRTGSCDPSYPDVCIPPFPPDLDCGDIPFRRFRVLPPDPHGFDRDHDGIGCESG
ncbi:MAG: hypothetical protein KatS3mg062_0466 [Tepidiforma sp.]|nr:MAG: hypothetical protein KatS3mg062_0466 [Tepidiforma sp.]